MLFTAIIYTASLSLLLASRWIRGEWKWGYLIGGFCFGLYNEFLFEFCWDYSPALKPFVWRDVPLIVVTGWGVIGIIAMSVSDRVQAWGLRRFPGLQGHPGLLLLALDVLVYAAVGVPQEVLMSDKGYWKYNFPLQGELPIQILGYVGVALLLSSLGRRIESFRSAT